MGLKPKTTKYFFPAFYIVLLGLVGAPSFASAFSGVTITEILYDASGSDVDREWVEVTNLNNEPTDIAKYMLQESTSNHRFSLFTGSSELAAGESAILAKNPASFAAAYPNYDGAVLKAAFSLSNTGETLKLKNASSTVVDSVTYATSKGAQGDGNSLHRMSKGLQAGTPDPGIYTESVSVVIKKDALSPVVTRVKEAPLIKTTSNRDTGATPDSLPATTQTVAVQNIPLVHAAEAMHPQSAPLPFIEAGVGLAALIVLGVSSIWYANSVTQLIVVDGETKPTAQEFDIEG